MQIEKIFSSPFVVPVALFCIPIVAIIAHYWHEVLKTRSNNELKQSMVERGMSAGEIEQVVNAGNPSEKKKG